MSVPAGSDLASDAAAQEVEWQLDGEGADALAVAEKLARSWCARVATGSDLAGDAGRRRSERQLDGEGADALAIAEKLAMEGERGRGVRPCR